jgi:ferredoxin-NADP reductase
VTDKLHWQNAVLRTVVRQTARISSFVLEPERPFAFRAGQHVDVRLTAEDGYSTQRSYSIASAPEAGPQIELAIERLEDGEVSAFFHDVAAVGDAIELRGPIGGHFVWSVNDAAPIVLLGGGSGLVPLMSIIRHRALQRSAASVALLLSCPTWEDVLYRDELLALEAERSGFELALTLTREPPRRARDYARRIDGPMLRDFWTRLPAAPSGVFVCGSNPFVEAATQAVAELGVPAKRVRTERYGG